MIRWLIFRAVMVSLALTSSACIPILHSPKPWVKHPMPAPPDRACAIGHESVTVYYVWDCIAGEHVVVSQFLSSLGPYEAKREAVRCGELTRTESDPQHNGHGINDYFKAGSCSKVIDDYRWHVAADLDPATVLEGRVEEVRRPASLAQEM